LDQANLRQGHACIDPINHVHVIQGAFRWRARTFDGTFCFVTLIHIQLTQLQYSKRTCADLLKGERLYSVIGNPFALIKRTAVNQQANVNKGRTLREAKEITKRAREEEEEKEEDEQEEENEDDDEDEDDDSSAPIAEAARPRKRAKGAHST
jgi:hypothetical protein